MNQLDYYEQHHHITESAIGLIDVYLRDDALVSALHVLNKCKEDLDNISQRRFAQLMKEMFIQKGTD